MKSILNHVAVLVESIESVIEKSLFESHLLGEIAEFPSEGTRELYIGSDNQMGKLLLMQANGSGPYQDALEKRGAGLHHIAIDVLNVDEFVLSLSGSGWYLHPKSLDFYKSIKQVWLTRPGVPVLIEVNETKFLKESNFFIEEMSFPFLDQRLLNSLYCSNLRINSEATMKVKNNNITVKILLK